MADDRAPKFRVTDLYSVENMLFAGRSADAYRAIHNMKQAPVTLWMSHAPFINSENVRRQFENHITALQRLLSSQHGIVDFGIDRDGRAFAALSLSEGVSILHGADRSEAERRYIAALRIVERLHRGGIALGDISDSSFWILRGGEVRLGGIMGDFVRFLQAQGNAVPSDVLPYEAPEQSGGDAPTMRSDVYALGVLLFRSFAGKFPLGRNPEQLADEMAKLANVPGWVSEVVERCLSLEPSYRYESANALAKDIIAMRERELNGATLPANRSSKSVGFPAASFAGDGRMGRPRREPGVGMRRAMQIVTMIVGGSVVLSGAVWLFSGPPALSARPLFALTADVDLTPELRKAMDIAEKRSSAAITSDEMMQALVGSSDPLAFAALREFAANSSSIVARQRVERALVDRARGLDRDRTAEALREWLQRISVSNELPDGYRSILELLEPSTPIERLVRALRLLSAQESSDALSAMGGLVLDSESPDELSSILGEFVKALGPVEGFENRNVFAVLAAMPATGLLYGDDLVPRLKLLPTEDLRWLLPLIAVRRDGLLGPVAHLLAERSADPVEKVYYGMLRDRSDADSVIIQAIINGLEGNFSAEDIRLMSQWYDQASEMLLYGVLVRSSEPGLRRMAMDALLGKSTLRKDIASLLDFIRQHHYDERERFARVIGIIGFGTVMSHNEIVTELRALSDLIRKEPRLLDPLLMSERGDLVSAVLDLFEKSVPPSRLLTLLDHPSAEVRSHAVRGLAGFNQAQILKVIIERFDREKDPQVRQAYRDSFWVISERDAGPRTLPAR